MDKVSNIGQRAYLSKRRKCWIPLTLNIGFCLLDNLYNIHWVKCVYLLIKIQMSNYDYITTKLSLSWTLGWVWQNWWQMMGCACLSTFFARMFLLWSRCCLCVWEDGLIKMVAENCIMTNCVSSVTIMSVTLSDIKITLWYNVNNTIDHSILISVRNLIEEINHLQDRPKFIS